MSQKQVPTAEFSTDVKYLKDFLDALNEVRDEGQLIITDDRIFSKNIDPATVMMCVARIKGQALNGIKVDGGDEVVIGANFEDLSDMLSGIGGTSEVVVKYPIVVNGNNTVEYDVVDEGLTFHKTALNVDTVPKPPDNDPLKHALQIDVDPGGIKKAIDHINKIQDNDEGSVIFGMNEDMLYMEASKKATGDVHKEFERADIDDTEDIDGIQTEVAYSYLYDIKNILGSADAVTIHIKDDNPIRFDVSLDNKGDARIVYLIAPRIDNQ